MDTFFNRVYNFTYFACLHLLFISKRIFFVFAFYRDKLLFVIFRAVAVYIVLFQNLFYRFNGGIRGVHNRLFIIAYEKQRQFKGQIYEYNNIGKKSQIFSILYIGCFYRGFNCLKFLFDQFSLYDLRDSVLFCRHGNLFYCQNDIKI